MCVRSGIRTCLHARGRSPLRKKSLPFTVGADGSNSVDQDPETVQTESRPIRPTGALRHFPEDPGNIWKNTH